MLLNKIYLLGFCTLSVLSRFDVIAEKNVDHVDVISFFSNRFMKFVVFTADRYVVNHTVEG